MNEQYFSFFGAVRCPKTKDNVSSVAKDWLANPFRPEEETPCKCPRCTDGRGCSSYDALGYSRNGKPVAAQCRYCRHGNSWGPYGCPACSSVDDPLDYQDVLAEQFIRPSDVLGEGIELGWDNSVTTTAYKVGSGVAILVVACSAWPMPEYGLVKWPLEFTAPAAIAGSCCNLQYGV